MSIADSVVQSMKTHKRKPSDFYPSPAAATQGIVDSILREILPDGAKIAELACGNGAMARVLKANGYDVIASDIRHTGYGEGGVDFLRMTRPPAADAFVSNPPFDVAEEFIIKAVVFYEVVVLILKSNYWNTAGRQVLFEKYPPTDRRDFTWRLAFLEEERGKSPLMDCTAFVWVRGAPPLARPIPKPLVSPVLEPLFAVSVADLGFAVDDLVEVLREQAGT